MYLVVKKSKFYGDQGFCFLNGSVSTGFMKARPNMTNAASKEFWVWNSLSKMDQIILEKTAQKLAWLLFLRVNDQNYFLNTSEITKFEKVFEKVYWDLPTCLKDAYDGNFKNRNLTLTNSFHFLRH